MGRGNRTIRDFKANPSLIHGPASVEGFSLIAETDEIPDLGSETHRSRLSSYLLIRVGNNVELRFIGKCGRCGGSLGEFKVSSSQEICQCPEYVPTVCSATNMKDKVAVQVDAPPLGSVAERDICIQGFLDHEILHLIWSNKKVFRDFVKELEALQRQGKGREASQLKSIWNTLEDGMIEHHERYHNPDGFKYISACNFLWPRTGKEVWTVDKAQTMPKPDGYIPRDADGNKLAINANGEVVLPAGTKISLWGKYPVSPENQAMVALQTLCFPEHQHGQLSTTVAKAIADCQPHVDAAITGNSADCVYRAKEIHKIFKSYKLLADDLTDEERQQQQKAMENAMQQASDDMPSMPGGSGGGSGGSPSPGSGFGSAGASSGGSSGGSGGGSSSSDGLDDFAANWDDEDDEEEAPKPMNGGGEESKEDKKSGSDKKEDNKSGISSDNKDSDQKGSGGGSEDKDSGKDGEKDEKSSGGGSGDKAEDSDEKGSGGGSQDSDDKKSEKDEKESGGGSGDKDEDSDEMGSGDKDSDDKDSGSGDKDSNKDSDDKDGKDSDKTGDKDSDKNSDDKDGKDSDKTGDKDSDKDGDKKSDEKGSQGDKKSDDKSSNDSKSDPEAPGGEGEATGIDSKIPLPEDSKPLVDKDELEKMKEEASKQIEADKTNEKNRLNDNVRQNKLGAKSWNLPPGHTVQAQNEIPKPDGKKKKAIEKSQKEIAAAGRDLGGRLEKLKSKAAGPRRNLPRGRLDRKKLPASQAGNRNIYYQPGFELELDMEIDVSMDLSQSTMGHREGMYRMSKMFAVAGEQTDIPTTIYGWEGFGKTGHYALKERTSNDLSQLDSIFQLPGGGTPTAEGIAFARARLSKSKASFKLLPIITDGQPSGGSNAVEKAAEQVRLARAEGISVLGFGFKGVSAKAMDNVFGSGKWVDIDRYEEAAEVVAGIVEQEATKKLRSTKRR